MRGSLFFLLLTVLCKSISAADGIYAFNKIKPELLKGAHVVKRFEEIRFSVNSIKNAVLYHKYAFTVINEQGDKYARLLEGYDKIHSIGSIEGNLYDANGTKIKSLKKVRDEVNKVEKSEECGMMFEPKIDFMVGDLVQSFRTI